MSLNLLTCILFFTSVIDYCNGARILGIFMVPSKSHHILGSSLLKALAEKGHDVTMISPYPFKEKVENYRDIFVEDMLQFKEDNMQRLMNHNTTLFGKMSFTLRMFFTMGDIVLSHGEVQKLKDEKFDLIIQYAMSSECFLGLAHHFNAPVILFSTFGSLPPLDKIVGNVAPPSYVPSMSFHPLPSELTFFQRMFNVFTNLCSFAIIPILQYQQQQLLTKHFPQAPPLQELLDKVSLVFLNSHYSIESPRPYVPNMIQVGGIHVEEPKQLPPDLKQFLDEAVNGAIFFSLGSNVKISLLPNDKVEAILNVLGQLNMRVLFKTDKAFNNLSSSIKTGNWFPQNDILAHPNIKLFISHGGYLSTIEAVYHAVPIIGIPIFGDQHMNIIDAEFKGYALKTELDKLNEESFSNSIKEILNNPSYRQNIQLRSSLMRDQPLKPMDTAIFWVNHVLKHKGATHLRNAGVKLYLYQYLLLDVFVFILIVCLLSLWVIRYIFRKVIVATVKRVTNKFKVKAE